MDAFEPLKRLVNPDNLVDRITEAEKANLVQPTQIGNNLEEMAGNTGDLIVGNLISPAPEVEVMDVTSTDFTGSFMSGEGATFGSDVYNVGGVNAGTLQWGAKQTDGKLKAGAGAVVLDSDGVAVNVTDAEVVTNAYKIVDASGNVIGTLSGYKESVPTAYNFVTLTAKPITGRNPYASLVALADVGQNAIVFLNAVISGGNSVNITMNAYSDEILFNAANLKTATGYISSGSYTPTATGVTNMGTSSGWAANYLRVHNMVTVWGTAAIDPTTTATLTEVRITLPIASAMTTTSDLSGTMGRNATATGIGLVVADTTNDQALLRWTTDTASNATYNFHFSYIIK